MLKPTGDHILLLPDPVETKTSTGIILALDEKTEKYATTIGTIKSIGGSCWLNEEPWAKVGDRVYYAKHAGKFVKEGEVEYLMVFDEDILCVIEEDKDNG